MKKKVYSLLIYISSLLPLFLMEFLYHRKTPFMMDDLWYSTNLKTGENLHSIMDVLEGQVWHYQNWGGRSITHTLLQFILMGGELFADILNLLAAILLALVCTLYIRKEYKVFTFALASVLIISLNPNIQYSMFWQSGSVNYLYSTIWILTFAYLYLRELKADIKALKGIGIWIIPLGLITGWSNENMGPAMFCLSVMCIFYLWKQKRKPSKWMFLGSIFSLLGSAACILAPGNFVRNEFIDNSSILIVLKDRALSMLTGACSFLLPSFLVVLFLYAVLKKTCNSKMEADEAILLITGFLAYGAMLLSPHFPDRAAFGIMVINIILSLKLIVKICDFQKSFFKFVIAFYGTMCVYSVIFLAIRVF